MITKRSAPFSCSAPLLAVLVNAPAVSSWRMALDIVIWVVLWTCWNVTAKWTISLGEIHSLPLAQRQFGIYRRHRMVIWDEVKIYWVSNQTQCATNQYHCSQVFHRSALYHEAHCRTCPHTNIALRHHGTALDHNLRHHYTWVCIRPLKGVHLVPEIVLCPIGSE